MHLFKLLRRLDVQILVHLLRIVIFDLVVQVVQQQHFRLVQSFNDPSHLSRAALQVSSTVQLLRYFENLSRTLAANLDWPRTAGR